MAISFADKKRRIFAEARKPEAKTQLKNLAKALKNISKFPASERGELKKLVESIYENLVEKPKKGMQGGAKKSSTPTTKLSQILKEFKAKIGAERWREATSGTTIKKDMERPALKKGKRIVRRKGKTTNQYGTFKNKVGGVYYESRANRSDINQPSTKRYPKLEDGGEFMKGGIAGDVYSLQNPEQFKQLITIYNELADKTNLIKGYYLDHTDNSIVFLTAPNISDVGKDKIYTLVESLKKKGFSIINFEKSLNNGLDFGVEKGAMIEQSGKEGKANPQFFKLYLISRIKYNKGGTTGKKRIKRRKVTRQNENYDKKADSGLVGKPQGHRFTDKLAKKLGVKSYAKPTKEQIEKYRGRGVYSENRQDKSDVNPKRTYPSLGDGGEFGGGGRTGKKQIKRKKVTRQYPNYDKESDSGLVGKPQGHRFTDKLAKKLGVKSYAKPTKEQIEKYRGRGVYLENRQDKSDVNPKRTYPSL